MHLLSKVTKHIMRTAAIAGDKGEITKAIMLAAFAHDGQVDKGGTPYIFHALRVGMRGKTTKEIIVGLLHDTVEDSDITTRQIQLWFDRETADAVDSLTRRDNETYNQFIERVALNPLARQVKIYDLAENMDISRIPTPTPKDISLAKRYEKVYHRLTSMASTNAKTA